MAKDTYIRSVVHGHQSKQRTAAATTTTTKNHSAGILRSTASCMHVSKLTTHIHHDTNFIFICNGHKLRLVLLFVATGPVWPLQLVPYVR